MLPVNFEGVDVSVASAAGAGEAAGWAVVEIFANGFSAGFEELEALLFSDAKGFMGALAEADGALAGSDDFAGDENDCAKTLDVAESLVPLTVVESLTTWPFVMGIASRDFQSVCEPTGAPMA